ncbi:hybrid sensor histidine kinase/response regulator transcription factor [Plebeiibacterium sediminum]|uniref:histidine kinase n=1 Tax=Plebeiibacterium sediminum TaxID=2992112 RepID=A0AAE3M4P9_9BACT|nr:hybrid sensor histidine kinase/response regulator transcription factor [Plebeiobacterium sediminum]MCW3786998.1 response regulator [Plebeiobacterium sediminum]
MIRKMQYYKMSIPIKTKLVCKLIPLYFLLIYIQTQNIAGQNISFEHYQRIEGLSNNSVRSICQDSIGYLWFGTLNGLNKYDGINFHKYYHNHIDENSLASHRIFNLKCDSIGNLWAITYDGNAIMYNSKKDIYYNIKSFLNSENKTNEIHIKDIYIKSKNEILLTTHQNECIRVIISKNEILSATKININSILPGAKISFIFKGQHNSIWVGTNNGITILNDSSHINLPKYHYRCYCITDSLYLLGTQHNNIVAYNYRTNKISTLTWLKYENSHPISDIKYFNNSILVSTLGNGFAYYSNNNCKTFKTNNTKNLHSNVIFPGYIDRHDMVWFETDQKGVTQFNLKSQKVNYHSLNANIRESLGEPEKLIYFEDSNDDLWLGIYGGGICKYNRSKNTFTQYMSNPLNSESLSSNYVLSLFEDNCKNLWIGTLNGGINKLKLSEQNFKILQPDKDSNFITNNEVRGLYVDSYNNIWAGTKSGKLYCYDTSYKLLATLPDDIPSLKRLKIKNIYSIMEDHDNNLWIGTKGDGIFILKNLTSKINESKTERIDYVHIKRDPYKRNTLSSDYIYDILEINDSIVWAATHSGGLSIIKNPLDNISFTHYSENIKDTHSISSNILRCLYKDIEGNVWIGSTDGLSFVDKKFVNAEKIVFKTFKSEMGDTNSLNNDDIICIYQGKDSVLYCGTYGGGINYIKTNQIKDFDFRWKNLTTKQGLSSNVIYKILEDPKSQDIWISTDYGINKLKIKESSIKAYFPEDLSIQKYIYSENTGAFISDNTLLFGNLNGITCFTPDSIHNNTIEYPICITDVKISDESIQHIHENANLELKYFQNYLTFYFAVLDFSSPQKINYSFKLENFDETWNYCGNTNFANYKRLPPGKYTFKVKGTNSAGVSNNNIAKIDIVIAPPFWKTSYAIIGYLFIIILIVWKLRSIILKQLDLKNQLKNEHISINNKLNFYTNISHELKTPLTLIKGPAEDIIRKNSASEEIKSKANEILKNTGRILDLINQLIDFRKIQNGHIDLSVQHVNISMFFKEIFDAFETLAIKEDIVFKYSSEPTEIFGYIDTDKIEKITFNLISNAFKHTPKGKEISLKIALIKEDLIISVTDQGKGIAKDEINHIFERFVLFSKSDKMFNSSSGLGLSLTKELVNAHKGDINVTSKVNVGSSFTIRIPVNKDSYNKNEILKSESKNLKENNTTHHLNNVVHNEPVTVKNTRSAGADAPSVLLIEDNQDLRTYLYNNLKSYFNVRTASNGKEGLEIATNEKPDIVVSDIMMPEKDGLEVTRDLKNNINTSHIPVILLTAKSSLEQIQMGFECGADDYISKPFSFALLKTRITNLIEQRKKLEYKFSDKSKTLPSTVNISEKGKDTIFISQVTKYTELHMSDPDFTIDSIVKEFNYGRSVFYKKIKTITGYTPTEFVKSIKMKNAALKLIETSKTINEISSLVGFNDSDYFCRAFKKHYGLTPSNYRNQKQN